MRLWAAAVGEGEAGEEREAREVGLEAGAEVGIAQRCPTKDARAFHVRRAPPCVLRKAERSASEAKAWRFSPIGLGREGW